MTISAELTGNVQLKNIPLHFSAIHPSLNERAAFQPDYLLPLIEIKGRIEARRQIYR